MSYVNFKLMGGDKCLMQKNSYACYRDVSYSVIPADATHMICFQRSVNIERKMIQPWVDAMNEMGFPVEYGVELNNHEMKDIFNDALIFVVRFSEFEYKSHFVSTITLLRYMWEQPHENIIKSFFAIKDELPDLDNFKALLMAEISANPGNYNHRLTDGRGRVFFTRAKLFKEFAKYAKIKAAGQAPVNGTWQAGRAEFTMNAGDYKDYKKLNKKMEKGEKAGKFVYVVGGATNYANWLDGYKVTNTLTEADLVLFTGGEDVDPSFYKEKKNPRTFSNPARDRREKGVYEKALALGIPMLGICRGSQFLCVMAGGKLVQHQDNPSIDHPIFTDKYGVINITSTHHQAAFPYVLPRYNYRIIGWTEGISPMHEGISEKEELNPEKECEIVYYRAINALGIQGHPEMDHYQKDPDNKESITVLKTIFNDFINRKL